MAQVFTYRDSQRANRQVSRPGGRKVSAERLKAIKEANLIPPVRVAPTDDKYRNLKHPNGAAFRTGSASAEWPNDRFTQRRVADGSIKIVDADARHRSAPARHHATRREATSE